MHRGVTNVTYLWAIVLSLFSLVKCCVLEALGGATGADRLGRDVFESLSLWMSNVKAKKPCITSP